MLRVYGKLLKAVSCSYVGSRACVRVLMNVSEWFPVNVGLRQGRVMSPMLFNVFIDDVVQFDGVVQDKLCSEFGRLCE